MRYSLDKSVPLTLSRSASLNGSLPKLDHHHLSTPLHSLTSSVLLFCISFLYLSSDVLVTSWRLPLTSSPRATFVFAAAAAARPARCLVTPSTLVPPPTHAPTLIPTHPCHRRVPPSYTCPTPQGWTCQSAARPSAHAGHSGRRRTPGVSLALIPSRTHRCECSAQRGRRALSQGEEGGARRE